jgi:uncharacterized membrane protein (GlpM family)
MAKEEKDLELLQVYRIQLKILDDKLNSSTEGEPKDKKIPALLEASGSDNWFALYEAEQRLFSLMSPEQIKAEAPRRFEEATRLGIPSAAPLLKEYGAATTEGEKKALLISLMDDIHFGYTKRRLDRSMRKKSAQLFYISGITALLPLIAFIVAPLFISVTDKASDTLQIGIVLYFGILGAYFSRIIGFQSSLDRLDYDILVRDYSGWSLTIRLLTGLIGALLVYMLINSQLLGGTLFPAPGKIVMWQTEGDSTLPLPSLDFSKLIIWGVIAGFSERFIPDQLTRLETSARDKPAK